MRLPVKPTLSFDLGRVGIGRGAGKRAVRCVREMFQAH